MKELTTDVNVTTREIFEKVRNHLMRQKERCADKYGTCYCRKGRLKCAVGCLIDERYYHAGLEQNSANKPIVLDAVAASIGRHLNSTEIELLLEMQGVHDVGPVDSWESALEELEQWYHQTLDIVK